MIIRILGVMLCGFALGGCSWKSADGQRAHLVFGLGIVKTAGDQPSHTASSNLLARAERVEATGLLAGPVVRGFIAGRAVRQSVSIRPDADLLLESGSNARHEWFVDVVSTEELLPETTREPKPKENR